MSQTISVAGDVPKPRKVIAGKEPRPAGPKSAGPKPVDLKTVASKEPRSAGPKSAGPMPTGPKTAGGRPPRQTVGGKASGPSEEKIKTRVWLVELRSHKQKLPRGTSSRRHFASYK